MDSQTMTVTVPIPDDVDMKELVGPADINLRRVGDAFDCALFARGNEVRIDGSREDTARAKEAVERLVGAVLIDGEVTAAELAQIIGTVAPVTGKDEVILSYRGKVIRPKTANQRRYVDSIKKNTITFGYGCAGTGKTYLAVALALAALDRREVGRIVLTRPIVEAGENLGFLPGTLTEKVDPYIRPLYDALYDMHDPRQIGRLIDEGIIEIAPLAFMRGRTLNDSFIILDEAQNATPEQMKMFLTRLGFGSKMVVTGDMSQSDLSYGPKGLVQALDVLEGIDDIGYVAFDGGDVVRQTLVAKIVRAYEEKANGAKPMHA